ncbi:unnamed protein product, partial [Rotaria sp. Silwood2]
ETLFVDGVFENNPLNNIQFRLSSVYRVYITLRYRLSPYGKENFSLVKKQENVISLLYRIEDIIIEEPELNLPFLLPEDGYTCENIRGIIP